MSDNKKTNRILVYSGLGLVFGAALGMLFGILFLENLLVGLLSGAALGLIIGAILQINR